MLKETGTAGSCLWVPLYTPRRLTLTLTISECPQGQQVYTDAEGSRYCWFMPLGASVYTWDEARHFCSNYSLNATSLYEPRSLAANDFFTTTKLFLEM